jgi:DNA-binding response OmpR family regulator
MTSPGNKEANLLRILCLEEHRSLRDCISLIVSHPHYHVDVVESAAQALARARWGACDVLIVDNEMARTAGIDVIMQFRKAGYAGKIIVLGGELTPQTQLLFQDFRVDGILSKPVTPQRLLEVIDALTR